MFVEDLFFVGVFLAFAGFFGFLILIGIVLYILQAIGLFKIAKREGKGNIAWLAWIPAVGQFLLTYLVEKYVHPGLRGKFTLLFGIAFLVSIMFAYFLPYAPFIPMAIYFYAFYFIAKRYTDNPVLHVAIAVVSFGSSIPVQIFLFRNREMVEPEAA